MIKDHNLSASLEDYLEAIFNLTRHKDVARSKDIADGLRVARPSVTGALRLLAQKGLVNHEPYGLVSLTKAGQSKAAQVARKHDIIKSFFVDILEVEEKSAAAAACRAEHTLGKPIVSRLMSFIEFVTYQRQGGNNLVADFRKFHHQKEKSDTDFSVKQERN
ncbi:MAG: metal-dependent transcriptional regulator [Sedimentisphaerales bacterium]|nr:metal-dependent transcriptional regulator [Sedimentisphaerales bacterium]